jgi:hypothetical protein
MSGVLAMFYKVKIYFLNPHNWSKCNIKNYGGQVLLVASQTSLGSLYL